MSRNMFFKRLSRQVRRAWCRVFGKKFYHIIIGSRFLVPSACAAPDTVSGELSPSLATRQGAENADLSFLPTWKVLRETGDLQRPKK